MKPRLWATIALACLAASSGGRAEESGGGEAAIAARVDFADPNGAEVDAFLAKLAENDGRPVALRLEIVPKQSEAEDIGYVLAPRGAPQEPVRCGRDGTIGNVDNLQDVFELSFQHPDHYHAPVMIIIGDRLRYPFHAIRCGVERYTENALTNLHVSGAFVATVAEIPTANVYTLYPYDGRR